MLEIVTYPNEILKKKTSPVKTVDSEIKDIVENMKQTMYKNEGIGLAANQVNLPLSIMIIDTTASTSRYEIDENQEHFKGVLINPELIEAGGEHVMKEGCLSFPGLQVEVKRFSNVLVKAINEHEEEVILNLSGFPAIVFQHESDHLNGITFIDRISGIKKRLALEKYKKMQKEKALA